MAAELDTVRDEGEAYAEKLRDAGVDVTSKLFPGQEHEFFTKHEDDDGFREQAQAMAIAFLEEKCKSPSILTQEEGL
jgi:acetyl esterase/lipase